MVTSSLSTGLPYLAAPYHTGGATSILVGTVFPVSIDGHGYMVDWTKYQRQTLEAQRPAFDNHAEPGEQTLNPTGFWRRSQSRFDLGAGQAYYDDEQADAFLTSRVGSTGSIRQRYYASKGIDPWQDNGIRLLPAVLQLASSAETNLLMLNVGAYLYFVIGDALYYSDGVGAAVGPIALPADPTSITTDGTNVYIAYGTPADADVIPINSLVLAAYGTLNPTLLRYANGRMIAAEGGDLWEYDSAGAAVGTALVAPDFGGTWVDAVGTPVGIFAALNVGSYRGELYVMDVDDTTGGLNPGRFAARLNNGETFRSLYFYGNVIVAGTNLGIRIFVLAGQGGTTAEMQPLIEISGGVNAMSGTGEFVWFGWSNYDSVSTGLGRMNLARSNDPDAIVPPYASDLMVTAQGTIASIAIFAGVTYFSVAGVGVYLEDTTGELVPSGTFDSGWVRMGTLAEKSFAGVELGHDALAGTVDVELLEYGSVNPTGVGGASTAGGTSTEVLGPSIKSRAVRVQLTLNRDAIDDEAGPVVRWWTLLGYPAPPRAQEIILPVMLQDQVDGLDRSKQPVDVLGEKEHLDRLARDGEVVAYREFDLSEQVIVTQIIYDADEDRQIPQASRPTTRRWLQGTAMVRLLTKES